MKADELARAIIVTRKAMLAPTSEVKGYRRGTTLTSIIYERLRRARPVPPASRSGVVGEVALPTKAFVDMLPYSQLSSSYLLCVADCI